MPVLSETEISARWIFILDLEGYSRNAGSSIEKLAHQSLNAPISSPPKKPIHFVTCMASQKKNWTNQLINPSLPM
jgi:hypothetical protein